MNGSPLRFGLALPQRGVLFGVTTIDEMLHLARQAEQSGLFDSVSIGDSLLSKPRPDSLALLGALAAATQKVTLSVGCMATFAIRDPLMFACQWATLDQISNGRMLLAACTGIVKPDSSAREGSVWGLRDSERAARLEENIVICRRLWGGDGVSYSGRYRSFEDVTLLPKPVQEPCPIWIAANPSDPRFVERSMRRVARLADGWMSADVRPGLLASNWHTLQTQLAAQGRDPDEFPNAVVHNININDDRDAAFEESNRFLDEYYGPVLPLEFKKNWTAFGPPDECIARCRQLVNDGAKSLVLRTTTWNLQQQFERLIREVLPYVNG